MDNTPKMCQEAKGNLGIFKFIKMHGCGNDYVYFDGFERDFSGVDIGALARRFSDRHKGIGSDGVVLIEQSGKADAKMRMFNADGSESGMCGNAIRCVGKFMYESGKAVKPHMEIETLSGVKMLEIAAIDGVVNSVRVDMGAANLKPEDIPVDLVGESIIGRRVTVDGQKFEITCVSMGNPHAVIFHDDIDHFDLPLIGPLMETAKIFPQKVNLEVAQIVSRNNIRMRVWERGSGETMACGTGACAVAVAAVLMGYCDKDTDIQVQVKGGVLTIKYTDDTVYMTGSCERVFEGEILIS
ncbi:MAG: diaminopimelate epimerase [Defluviitaleaceae bacterium]|nr:diaminopimelate epimerase [Defluviitaleaceae bacterium]